MARYALLRLSRRTVEAEPVTEVNIIPVIDISLVLLVILFVTAPLLSYPSVPVSLPKADAKESVEGSLAVTLTKDGRLAVRAQETDWANLAAALSRELKRQPDAVVMLRADKAVPYREVQRLLSAAKAAGARQMAIATEGYR